MATVTIRHGTEAGYREELLTDSVCDRCIKAHRVFMKQYTKAGKKAGVKYGRHEVIDQLYRPGRTTFQPGEDPRRRGTARSPVRSPERVPPGLNETGTGRDDQPGSEPPRPSLASRLSDGLGRLAGQSSGNEYVETDGPPDYISAGDPDPEPNDNIGWSEITDEDVVITKEGMARIEDNLGTYLSVVGITFEMIDPYCGPILAENLDNIVSRWTKVIARYPRAAKLFLSKDGGTLFLWIGALQATWPVLLAIYEHHLSRSVQTDKQGRIFRVHPSSNEQATVDATMPPMPEYEYSVS